jgi:hypothetical protein
MKIRLKEFTENIASIIEAIIIGIFVFVAHAILSKLQPEFISPFEKIIDVFEGFLSLPDYLKIAIFLFGFGLLIVFFIGKHMFPRGR